MEYDADYIGEYQKKSTLEDVEEIEESDFEQSE